MNPLSIVKDLALNKTRLFIEYLLIGFVVSLAGATLTLWLQKNTIEENLTKTQKAVTELEVKTTTQDQTIIDLKDLRSRDAVAIDGLITDYKTLASNSKSVNDKLKKLEQTNEEVRRYMRDPLPAALKCVLNNTCQADPANSDRATQTPIGITPILPITK